MRLRVRTNTLTGYATLARSAGLDPVSLLGEVGLDIAELDVPDRWIPAAPVARLLELSAERAGSPDFALRLAELRRLGTLGPLGVVLRDQPDLRSAVDLLIRYERTYNEALHLRLSEADGAATIAVWLEFGEPAPREQALDLVMAALIGTIRELVGSDWWPLSAAFTRSTPPDRSPWHALFGPGVVFDQGATCLVLRVADLALPVVAADASLRPYTQEFLRTAIGRPEPLAATDEGELVEAVELLLPLGRGSLPQVSRHLGVGPRRLQRDLADRGESFASVLHATRARLAERYLPIERYSLTEVSRLLGFQAPSAFSRWFRQQFGTTPQEWRRAARAGLGGQPGRRTVSGG
jgi:AraC-like DNA-binding protein